MDYTKGSNGPMTITRAAALMQKRLFELSKFEREYIVQNFIAGLLERGITPSESFLEAFELATAPFREPDSH